MEIKNAVLKGALKKLASDLSEAKLARKKKLQCPRRGSRSINDLTGIEVCTGLTELDLSEHTIKDIAPLAPVVKLKKLHLHGNAGIRDISPLKKMTQLEVLYLAGTKVSDVSPLKNMPLLRVVSLSESDVEDISALRGLGNLETVVLRDCKKLNVEEGNATYETVTTLLDNGVNVYLQHPLIEQYKSGDKPKRTKAAIERTPTTEEKELASQIKDVINELCPDSFDVGMTVTAVDVEKGASTKVTFDIAFSTYDGESVKEQVVVGWTDSEPPVGDFGALNEDFTREVIDAFGAEVDAAAD